MNPQDKEQKEDKRIKDSFMMNFAVCPECDSYIIINEAIKKAKQEERERILGIIDKELSFLNDFSFKNKSDKELWYVRKSVYQYLKIKINSEVKEK